MWDICSMSKEYIRARLEHTCDASSPSLRVISSWASFMWQKLMFDGQCKPTGWIELSFWLWQWTYQMERCSGQIIDIDRVRLIPCSPCSFQKEWTRSAGYSTSRYKSYKLHWLIAFLLCLNSLVETSLAWLDWFTGQKPLQQYEEIKGLTHNLLLAKDNDLHQKDEAGQKLARHHLETCERQRLHCRTQILDFTVGFLAASGLPASANMAFRMLSGRLSAVY